MYEKLFKQNNVTQVNLTGTYYGTDEFYKSALIV